MSSATAGTVSSFDAGTLCGVVASISMSTERQKMLAGELYDPFDPELVAAHDDLESRFASYEFSERSICVEAYLHGTGEALRSRGST